MSDRDRFVWQARQVAEGYEALVPMADFLRGNMDASSIAPNLIRHPGMETFSRVFTAIERRDDVHGVWALVALEYDEYPDHEWPFAASVYVVTSAPEAGVQAWVAELDPDECGEVREAERPARLVVPPGHRAVVVWWD